MVPEKQHGDTCVVAPRGVVSHDLSIPVTCTVGSSWSSGSESWTSAMKAPDATLPHPHPRAVRRAVGHRVAEAPSCGHRRKQALLTGHRGRLSGPIPGQGATVSFRLVPTCKRSSQPRKTSAAMAPRGPGVAKRKDSKEPNEAEKDLQPQGPQKPGQVRMSPSKPGAAKERASKSGGQTKN